MTPTNPEQTERTDAREGPQATRVSSHLFLVIEGARIASGGARIALSTVRSLRIGRGDQRVLRRAAKGEMSLTIPDSRMSGEHARVSQTNGVHQLEDASSTNGTTVNGEPLTPGHKHRLLDGDLLELGQSLFLYRELEGDAAAVAHDLDVDPARTEPAWTTLDPELSRRLELLARVAESPLSILLQGETGTGKEVLARAVHEQSKRPGRFVAVNCGAIPQNLVESQLFGHVRGAFSGALKDEPGLVRAAHQGTLLLDEVGDLPASSQAALLRVLQEGEVLPVGSAQTSKVDVRILAATHRSLEQLIKEGAFRRDLYARLAGYVFSLAPLRERKMDLGVLAGAMISSGQLQPPEGLRIHREALRAMLHYDWPMNVRELSQCLNAATTLARQGVITLTELPASVLRADVTAESPSPSLDDEDEAIRRELVQRLTDTRGNVSEVARGMGKARQQVQRWLRRFSLDPERFRG